MSKQYVAKALAAIGQREAKIVRSSRLGKDEDSGEDGQFDQMTNRLRAVTLDNDSTVTRSETELACGTGNASVSKVGLTDKAMEQNVARAQRELERAQQLEAQRVANNHRERQGDEPDDAFWQPEEADGGDGEVRSTADTSSIALECPIHRKDCTAKVSSVDDLNEHVLASMEEEATE